MQCPYCGSDELILINEDTGQYLCDECNAKFLLNEDEFLDMDD